MRKILLTIFLFLAAAFVKPVFAVEGEVNFSWAVPGTMPVATFDLFLDEKPFLTAIANQAGEFGNYGLFTQKRSDGNQEYRLISSSDLSIGQHQWVVIAYDANGEVLTTLPPQTIDIKEGDSSPLRILLGLWLSLWSSEVVWRTIKLVMSILLSVGLTVSLIFYGVLFISRLVVSGGFKGAARAMGFGVQNQAKGGLVFDVATYMGVPFALLTTERLNPDGSTTKVDTLVTDVDGIYTPINLPPGKYIVTASCNGFIFPVAKSRPAYMTQKDFYRGEEFVVEEGENVTLNIPMMSDHDHGESQTPTSLKNNFTLFVKSMWQILRRLHYPLWILSIIAMIWQFTPLHIFAVIFFGFLSIRTWLIHHRFPTLRGVVVDDQGQNINGAVVNLYDLETHHLVAISLVNNGKFSFTVPINTYQLTVHADGYTMVSENGRPNATGMQVTAGAGNGLQVISLKPHHQSSDDFMKE